MLDISKFNAHEPIGAAVVDHISRMPAYDTDPRILDPVKIGERLRIAADRLINEHSIQRDALDTLVAGTIAKGKWRWDKEAQDRYPGVEKGNWSGNSWELEAPAPDHGSRDRVPVAFGKSFVSPRIPARHAAELFGSDGICLNVPDQYETIWQLRHQLNDGHMSMLASMGLRNRDLVPRVVLEPTTDSAIPIGSRLSHVDPCDAELHRAAMHIHKRGELLDNAVNDWGNVKSLAVALLIHHGVPEGGRPHRLVAPDVLPGWRFCLRLPVYEGHVSQRLVPEFSIMRAALKESAADDETSRPLLAHSTVIPMANLSSLNQGEWNQSAVWEHLTQNDQDRYHTVAAVAFRRKGSAPTENVVSTFDGLRNRSFGQLTVNDPSSLTTIRWWEVQ